MSLMIVFSVVVLNAFCKENNDKCADKDATKAIDIINQINMVQDSIIKHNNLTKYLNSIIHSEEKDCTSINKIFKLFIAPDVISFLFKDLCNEILIYHDVDIDQYDDELNKQLKISMNEHFNEDGTHWKLYLNDWINLNLDNIDYDTIKLSDFYSFIFGDLTKWNRLTIYKFIEYDAKLNGDKTPINRYIMVRIVEIHAQRLFGLFTQILDAYYTKCNHIYKWNDRLKFISHRHSELEDGNLQIHNQNDNDNDKLQLYDNMKINDDDKQLLIEYGLQYVKVMDNYWTELYQFMIETNQQQNIWKF